MANLSSDEKATLMALMSRLLEDDTQQAMAEAITADAEASVERAAVYAHSEAAELEARQEHELAVIDAQADATVRVIEAEVAGATAVAAIDAAATTHTADVLADGITIDTPTVELAAEPTASLDAAADVLAELTENTPGVIATPLEVPEVGGPTVADIIDEAPKPQHWWTKERGRRRAK
jgi:hypothetical protein